VKSKEIIIITLLVFVGFLIADYLVDNFMIHGADQRFIIRLGFQASFFILIYLFFDSRDNSQRLRKLERRIDIERRTRTKARIIRKKVKKNKGR
jgi:hypothetical protein